MNYLAHAYLSFGDEEILVGNMISDFVKGKKKFDYPEGIQKGIALHRAIDEFTDDHAVTKTAKQLLRPAADKYAGAFMDVVYDHFLATDTNEFANDEALLLFTQNTYDQLGRHANVFPERFGQMFPYMRSQNWLYNYQFTKGIEKSFGGLTRRAVYISDPRPVFLLFEKNYTELKKYYSAFFPELKAFAISKLPQLRNT